MKEVNGAMVYEEGEEITVNLPEEGSLLKIKAVKGRRDNDFCFDCALFGYCRSLGWKTRFSPHCYTTIFEII